MIEQPLGARTSCSISALQRRLRTPLCLDEVESPTWTRARDMLTLGRRAHRQHQARARRRPGVVARHPRRCRRPGCRCGGRDAFESGVGRAYNVALASLPGFTHAGRPLAEARATGTGTW
jgi:O-succinylbenzoate synthase